MLKVIWLYAVYFFSSVAIAQESTYLVSDKVLAKCYVEVLGGKRTIHKVTIEEKQLPLLAARLSGRNIRVSGSKGFNTVHKVFECVTNNNPFKADRARHIEESQIK